MEQLDLSGNTTLLLKNRFKHITCVTVQIYKLEGNTWLELTKDFVLLHMYYDKEDNAAKLIAIDGIKLIVRGFVISSTLQLVRPTKKFVHFISSKQGRSEMYGFGFYQVYEVEQFLRSFNIVYRKLYLSSRNVIQNEFEYNKRHPSISSTKTESSCHTSLTTTTSKKDTRTIPSLFSTKNSPCREQVFAVDVKYTEKELQKLSFASATSSTLTLMPSLLTQTSVNARNGLYCSNSATLDANSDVSRSVEQKQYQLWDATPWNTLLEQEVCSNQESITSTWNSLLNR
uniref:WH1 domain-containing protein n=1 Tax=Wuchereria bancrofti TaxID=6293 RepID=A0AAF5PRZ7_WUCBA